jgi:hypothetical protein
MANTCSERAVRQLVALFLKLSDDAWSGGREVRAIAAVPCLALRVGILLLLLLLLLYFDSRPCPNPHVTSLLVSLTLPLSRTPSLRNSLHNSTLYTYPHPHPHTAVSRRIAPNLLARPPDPKPDPEEVSAHSSAKPNSDRPPFQLCPLQSDRIASHSSASFNNFSFSRRSLFVISLTLSPLRSARLESHLYPHTCPATIRSRKPRCIILD